MKLKKRKKSSRFRGSHTNRRGGKKKARGSGHQGGKGLAGTGKRGDQRKTLVLNLYGNDYFGKSKTLRRKQKVKLKEINLRDIELKHGHNKDINLVGYKILADGEIKGKYKITATSASKVASEKIKKAGSELILQSIHNMENKTNIKEKVKKSSTLAETNKK